MSADVIGVVLEDINAYKATSLHAEARQLAQYRRNRVRDAVQHVPEAADCR